MTDGEETAPSPALLRITAALIDDKRTVALQFLVNGTVAWSSVADATSVDSDHPESRITPPVIIRPHFPHAARRGQGISTPPSATTFPPGARRRAGAQKRR